MEREERISPASVFFTMILLSLSLQNSPHRELLCMTPTHFSLS
jgi:hypothetical protein